VKGLTLRLHKSSVLPKRVKMVNPLRNRLSIHIVRDFFGEVAENVCNTVMQHGEATLDDLCPSETTLS
jgi:hypothetical protein